MELSRFAAAAAVGVAIALTAPVSTQSAPYTHFVTPTGSSTSACTQQDPCSLRRAVSLIGTGIMPAGSVVLLQYGSDGVYSQGTLTFAGSGKATAPIKFVGEPGVRISGTRVSPEPSAWTLVAGRRYTYELDWDETTSFVVLNAAQRPPVATWRPILVDDRIPPFTRSLGRPFYLDFPVRYTLRKSIADVESQHCTIWNDQVANKVYVHMCHDGPPADADNLYLGSYGWGAIVIEGDYLWLENIALEQVNGVALKVNPSARGTVLKKIAARASQVWLEGVNTLAEDLDVSHVISQGFGSKECYDANPTFGVGECWNAAGDGRALLIGRQNGFRSFNQIVRRARIHRSWNGMRIDGPHVLEHSTLWGFPNHTLEASGYGAVIRHNVMMNGQDSIWAEPFDYLAVEHNVLVNAALFWASRDAPAATRPRMWWFRYNIAPAIVVDDKTFPAVASDCNLWLPSSANSSHLMKVTSTHGRPTVTYRTLAEVQTWTPHEQRSLALPTTQWTDGTLFKHFVGQSTRAFDFSPVNTSALSACGRKIGPSEQSGRGSF